MINPAAQPETPGPARNRTPDCPSLDITQETLVRGNSARKAIKATFGRSVSNATYWRWMVKGVRGVKLESVVIGGGRFTSCEAIKRLHAVLNAPKDPAGQRTSDKRLALRINTARATLDAMGVCSKEAAS